MPAKKANSRNMLSEVIEKSIEVENRLDEIIISYFRITNFYFRFNFLYGKTPVSFGKKAEVLEGIQGNKYRKLAQKIERMSVIRSSFAHDSSASSATVGRKELEEFKKLYEECIPELDAVVKEVKK